MNSDRYQIPEIVKSLSDDVRRMLRAVEPSIDGELRYYPCEVETEDGVMHPRVYVVEAGSYIRWWGVWPWDDRGKSWLPAEQIRSLRSSSDRLPAKFANVLYEAGESGMGYCRFSVELRDHRSIYFVAGGAVDFLSWPDGVGPDDVISVKPHDRFSGHLNRAPYPYESGADYIWSPFRTID